jgi:hypothetical protein
MPAFQFYTGDWMKDPNLRRCSLAARGVWIDMICLMFDSEVRGVLATNGVAWSEREIAATISGETSQILTGVEELLRKGVVSRDDSEANSTGIPGAIFSRRMVRDEKIRQANRDRQDRFRGKALHNGTCNASVTPHVTPLSHRSSSSSAITKQEPALPRPDSLKEPGAVLPEMVAQAVMDRSRLAGMGLSVVLHRVAKLAMDAGEDGEALAERMVKAWDDFLQAKPRLKWFPGAEKFFGEMWESPAAWPWEKGCEPAVARGKRKYATPEVPE